MSKPPYADEQCPLLSVWTLVISSTMPNAACSGYTLSHLPPCQHAATALTAWMWDHKQQALH